MILETWTLQELEDQKEELRQQLAEIEDMQYAMAYDPAFNFRLLSEIPTTQIDALSKLDIHPRIWADAINEGTATLQSNGMILNCNARFARMVQRDIDTLIGQVFQRWIVPEERALFELALKDDKTDFTTNEFRLRTGKGQTLPVRLSLHRFETEQLNGVCVVVTDLSERKQVEQDLVFVSTHDALTGLYNHNYFYEELNRQEHGRAFPVSIVFIDLDEMKSINDRLGHAMGDQMLKRAARVLKTAFRSEDIIARVGGDEFAILLPETDTPAARTTVERVKQLLAPDNAGQECLLELSFSFGVATGQKGESLTEVLKIADQAMYADKRQRRALQVNTDHEYLGLPTTQPAVELEPEPIGTWDIALPIDKPMLETTT